ncbi:MAG: hypothetical protein ABIQ11_11480 [Saprospiraceae bacterium]
MKPTFQVVDLVIIHCFRLFIKGWQSLNCYVGRHSPGDLKKYSGVDMAVSLIDMVY